MVATKVGLVRSGAQWLPDGRARHIRSACEASRRALGVECVELLQLHARDPRVPLATSLRALARLQEDGKIHRVGLCNVRLAELEQATTLVDVASVQVALHPFDPSAVKNGVLDFCRQHGITLLAHSPLGGPRRGRALERHPVLLEVAGRHGVSCHEVALAWLLHLDPVVLPLPGATRLESVESSLRATTLRLAEADLAALDHALTASAGGRGSARRAPAASRDRGDVVLLMGYPGAGKTTVAQRFVEQGYARLSRDENGGRLADLLPDLDRDLANGMHDVVLDNTYATRASRYDVIQTAARHGAQVRCLWLATSLEDAQVNAVRRMVQRFGRLLGPEEIKLESRKDPNVFSPNAQFRYRRELEEPSPDEGFSAIERLEFVRQDWPGHTGKALFFELDGVIRRTRSGKPYPLHRDDVELLPGRREALERFVADGFRLLAVSYQPEIAAGNLDEAAVRAGCDRARQLLGLDLELAFCPHGPGPPVCWCRKPLPGLGVVFVEQHRLDPRQCVVVAASAADRGFAARLGCLTIEVEELFPD